MYVSEGDWLIRNLKNTFLNWRCAEQVEIKTNASKQLTEENIQLRDAPNSSYIHVRFSLHCLCFCFCFCFCFS